MITFARVDAGYGPPGKTAAPVLSGLDFSIARGEFVCVLGPSGCGKTTLLHLVAGFVAPARGRVLVNGAVVAAPGPDRGVVFQDANLFPWLTVWDNVAFGLRRKGLKGARLREKVDRQLEIMRLRQDAAKYPYALSGGMRQRAAIARVLALEPDVLLMDEPFSALDAMTRERLQDELLQLHGAQQETVVYVTHSVEEAAYLGDRVIMLASNLVGPAGPAGPATVRADIRIPRSTPARRTDPGLLEAAKTLRNCLAGN